MSLMNTQLRFGCSALKFCKGVHSPTCFVRLRSSFLSLYPYTVTTYNVLQNLYLEILDIVLNIRNFCPNLWYKVNERVINIHKPLLKSLVNSHIRK